MIDIRYHLASIVGIFFALGIGMLMGAQLADEGALIKEYERLIGQIEAGVERVRADNRRLGEELTVLHDRLMWEQAFYSEVLGELIGGALQGVPVDVVAGAGAAPYADRVVRGLHSAGADVQVRDDGAAPTPGRERALTVVLWGEADVASPGPAQVAAATDEGEADAGTGPSLAHPQGSVPGRAGVSNANTIWGWPVAADPGPPVQDGNGIGSVRDVDTARGLLALIETLRTTAGLQKLEPAGQSP